MDLIITAVEFLAFTTLVAVISWWRTKDDQLDT